MTRLRVFLCHASEDKVFVHSLSTRLREDGFDPWLDADRLLPGQDWEFEISAAVRKSDVVVVCLSMRSVSKVGFLQKELRKVLDLADYQPEGRIFVVPVRLDECAVPSRIAQWQYADLFRPDGYERLCRTLRARSDEPPPEPDQRPIIPFDLPHGHEARRRRFIVAGIVLIVLLLVALAVWAVLRAIPTGTLVVTSKIASGTAPAGMVRIPAGRFLMGRNGTSDPEAAPAHDVAVAAFYLDRTPVTNRQYDAPLRAKDDLPVTEITWDEAYSFCLAHDKRLPTEAEWEFAARGTDGRLYPWGEAFEQKAVNSRASGVGAPEQVGMRPRNHSPFGVADMSGNVWQWCVDDYQSYPGHKASFVIPAGAKAIRGGSFQSSKDQVTTIMRNLELPSKRSPAIGFRCAK